jgi:uncharacterized membrane protein YhaH (DUF805 family)
MNWYLNAWRNTFNFSGRARRKEFWYFILVLAVLLIAPYCVEGYFQKPTDYDLANGIFFILYILHIVPLLSVTVRRLHDTNQSGWWCLLNMLGPLGTLALAYFCVKDSYFNYNQWGSVPKEMPSEEQNEPEQNKP